MTTQSKITLRSHSQAKICNDRSGGDWFTPLMLQCIPLKIVIPSEWEVPQMSLITRVDNQGVAPLMKIHTKYIHGSLLLPK